MTLGNAAAACVRVIVWCKDCRHQVERAAAEMAQRCGVETAMPDWRDRLVCSRCSSRRSTPPMIKVRPLAADGVGPGGQGGAPLTVSSLCACMTAAEKTSISGANNSRY